MEELLPVGSIVELNNKKRYMIIGYSPNKTKAINKYDYVVSHISGIQKPIDKIEYELDYFYIKKKDIKNIIFGFNDSEFDLYAKMLESFNTKINQKEKNKEKLESKDIKKVLLESVEDIKKSVVNSKNEK